MALKNSFNKILMFLILFKLCLVSDAASLVEKSVSNKSASNDEDSFPSKLVINFDLPEETVYDKKVNKTHANESDLLKFIINQSESLSLAASDAFVNPSTQESSTSTTASSSQTTTSETTITSTTETPTTTSNPQQLLIPPALVNASIAQIANAPKHKQGQIIIR